MSVPRHIGGDAGPEQLQGPARAIGEGGAGAAQLQDLAREVQYRPDVVFGRRVEAPDPRRGDTADEPVGAHHPLRPLAAVVVEHEQVVRHRVVFVGVEAAGGGSRIGTGAISV
jgi:hypothetical protein